MRYLLLIAAILAPAPPVLAQETAGDPAFSPAGTVIRRSLTVSSEMAFAVVPYARCLSDELQEHSKVLWEPKTVHPAAAVAKEQCATVRDNAIFLSATALEKNGKYDVEQRRRMIFEALSAIENQALIAPE